MRAGSAQSHRFGGWQSSSACQIGFRAARKPWGPFRTAPGMQASIRGREPDPGKMLSRCGSVAASSPRPADNTQGWMEVEGSPARACPLRLGGLATAAAAAAGGIIRLNAACAICHWVIN